MAPLKDFLHKIVGGKQPEQPKPEEPKAPQRSIVEENHQRGKHQDDHLMIPTDSIKQSSH